MLIESLIQNFTHQGIILSHDSTNGIRVKSPRTTLTVGQRQTLNQHKADILLFLKQQDSRPLLGSSSAEVDNACLVSEGQQAVEVLLKRNKPIGFSARGWSKVRGDIQELSCSPHLQELVSRGWNLKDLFGCHPTHPLGRYDSMGLVLCLDDKTIVTVSETAVGLKTKTGAIQALAKATALKNDQITLMELADDREKVPTNLAPSNPLVAISPVIHLDTGQEIAALEVPKELSLSELGRYYDYFEERGAIYEYEGHLNREEAEHKAMNDTVYQFMEDHAVDQGSLEVNYFIKQITRRMPCHHSLP